MAAEKSPAFQFYPKDFLTDGHVAAMSLQERGAYITLLCICWQEGDLPADVTRLARIVGVPPQAFRKLWPALTPCFTPTGDRLRQKRLDIERQKQAGFREEQAKKGAKRAQTGARTPDGKFQPGASRTTSQEPANGQPVSQPETSSPISDLRSPISKYRRATS